MPCLAGLHISAGEPELSAEHGRAALAAAETLGDEATLATTSAGVVYDDFVRGGPIVLDELERAVELERRAGRSTSVWDDRPIGMLTQLLWRVGEHDRSRALLPKN